MRTGYPTRIASRERLLELLRYDASTGVFTYLVDRRGRRGGRKAGDAAGRVNAKGYRIITIDGAEYVAHRLAWLFVHGTMPDGEVDHINGDKSDNRMCNLRVVDRSTNRQNMRRANAGSKSGLLGVSRNNGDGRWFARIGVDGKGKYLGSFDTPEQAHAAYVATKRQVHQGCTI